MALGLGIGTAHDEAPVGTMRECRPDLLPGDHPLVAVERRPRLNVREIAARVRLRKALAPQLVARLDRRQEASLLLLGAELDKGRCEQPLTEEGDARRRVRPRVLLAVDDLLREVRGAAAVLLGPVEPDPTIAAKQLRPLDPRVPALFVGRATTTAERGEFPGEMLGQPGPHLFA